KHLALQRAALFLHVHEGRRHEQANGSVARSRRVEPGHPWPSTQQPNQLPPPENKQPIPVADHRTSRAKITGGKFPADQKRSRSEPAIAMCCNSAIIVAPPEVVQRMGLRHASCSGARIPDCRDCAAVAAQNLAKTTGRPTSKASSISAP